MNFETNPMGPAPASESQITPPKRLKVSVSIRSSGCSMFVCKWVILDPVSTPNVISGNICSLWACILHVGYFLGHLTYFGMVICTASELCRIRLFEMLGFNVNGCIAGGLRQDILAKLDNKAGNLRETLIKVVLCLHKRVRERHYAQVKTNSRGVPDPQ